MWSEPSAASLMESFWPHNPTQNVSGHGKYVALRECMTRREVDRGDINFLKQQSTRHIDIFPVSLIHNKQGRGLPSVCRVST